MIRQLTPFEQGCVEMTRGRTLDNNPYYPTSPDGIRWGQGWRAQKVMNPNKKYTPQDIADELNRVKNLRTVLIDWGH